jgi:regulator of protease activity HflC (stomatin/prohibitin superfamily)
MNIASLFQGVSAIAWLALIGVAVLLFVSAGRNRPIRRGGMILLILAVVAVLFTTASAGMVFINPQERGVVISAVSSTGYRENALEPGLHWIIPFAENAVIYPISKETYTMSVVQTEGQMPGDDAIEARTSDGQQVSVDASVIYSVDPANVVQLHIIWQDRYSADLVRPVARGVIRDAVSQFGVEEVYSSRRLELVQMINKELSARLADNGLLLGDFVLRNISFSPEYAASVEQKQIAEQTAQQARFVVEQRRQEADQAREVAKGKADAAVTEAQGAAQARIIEAEAEAEALSLIAEVLQNNPDLLTYQYISQLSPNVQVMFLPSESPFLFSLPEMGPAVPQGPQAAQPTAQPTPDVVEPTEAP